MNNEQDFRDSELLESPLDAAIKETLAEPLPEEAIERVKTRAKLLAQSAAPTDTQTSRASNGSHRVCEETVGQAARLLDLSQKTNRRAACSTNDPQALRVRWGASVVAAMVLLVAATTLLIDRSASHAFAQVVEKMKAINSVRLMMVTQFGKQPEVASQMRLSGQLMRVEVNGGQLIQLADFEQKKMLLLDPQRKLSQSLDLDTEAAKGLINNPVEQLRRAKSDDAVALGEELLNGRRTQLYRLKKVDLLGITGSDEMLVWVDLASNLPAKIVVRDTDPKASTEIRFEGFVWGESQDAKLFSLSVPEGYQPAEIVLPRSTNPPTLSNGSESSAPVIVDGVIRDRVPGRIVWSHDGTAITALVRDPEAVPVQNQKPNELRQWDVASGKLRWSEVVAGANALATSADGKLLATVIGYEMQLRDAASGKVTQKWTTEVRLSALAFSPDDKTLAASITEWGVNGGRGDKASGGVQIWDIERSALIRTIEDDKPITFLKFSADGQVLATSSNAGPIKLWDATTGKLTRQVLGHSSAAFSPDGETLACLSVSAAADKTTGRVELYSLLDGSLLKTFTTAKGSSASYLLSVAFSPDGQSLAATDWNGTVTVWNAQSGDATLSIGNNAAGAHVGVFAPNGAALAVGREDKTLQLLKLSAESNSRVEPQK